MPTRKRQRAAPEAYQHLTSSPPQYGQHTRASLASLPPELKRRVIDFACLVPASSSSTKTSSSAAAASSRSCFFDSDVPTMLSLNLVCHELHDHVQPQLYRQITITRPSTLYALTQTLSGNPERAQLVQAIHIGPQDVLPRSWWPVHTGRSKTKLSCKVTESNITSQLLQTSLDRASLPSGCTDGHSWSLTLTPSGCRDEAVYNALKTAQHSLGLNLVRGIPQVGPLRIDRVLEMQAVLDLYLQHLKVLEDGNPDLAHLAQAGARVPLACRNGKCSHYPTLVLKDMPAPYTTSPNPPPATQANVFVLRYTQLLHHLARRGSITDRFDHPLLFERSGHTIAKLPNPDGSPVGHGYQLNPLRITWIFGGDRETANWPQLSLLNSIVNGNTSSPNEKALTAAVIAAGSVESCLRLARTLLASTTSLKVLSLTGFLQTAVDSHSVRLLSLRRLSLGPQPPGWHGLIRVAEVEQVEDLRLCNVSLEGREIQDLTSKLPMLRRLEWVMGRKVESGSGLSIVGTIQRLLEDNFHPTPAGESASSSTPAGTHGASSQGDALPGASSLNTTGDDSAPLILVRLHRTDVADVLATAASEETRQAWLTGTPFDRACRRLLLEESAAAAGESNESRLQDSRKRVWETLYEEGRGWSVRGEK